MTDLLVELVVEFGLTEAEAQEIADVFELE